MFTTTTCPVCMYVCLYGDTYGKSMYQPGKVANPARGQLSRENTYFPVRVRACVNDVPKIKIGKNQNQNWALIGRGSKPPDYASLFFGNRCQTKEVPRDLMFIFRKINIGGVHLIEGFPNATRQRPEHSRVTTAARRQTAPPHNTHNFCWHGPRQRSHGEGNR